MRSRIRSWGLAAALLAAGCGDLSEPIETVTVIQALTPAEGVVSVPREVTRFRFTGRGASGDVLFGPLGVEKKAEVVLRHVPVDVVALEIDYLAGGRSGEVGGGNGASLDEAEEVATFTTSIDLSSGSTAIEYPALVDTRDPVDASFAFVGCNRVAAAQVPNNLPSSANVGQLVQDFAEIPDPAHLDPTPRILFFIGDLVQNLEPGTQTLQSQLAGWKELYQETPLARSAVELVAVSGNHELNANVTDPETGMTMQVPNPPTGEVFTSEMADFIPASNGPTQAPPNLDGVERNESQLSFTFRRGESLFVAVDTDTYVGGTTTGDVPLHWLAEKIVEGNADPAVRNIFVLGHRPIDSPDPQNAPIQPSEAPSFYAILSAPAPDGSPTKVRGYFAAHAHLWAQGLPSLAPPGSTVQQVIAGNGGSVLSPVVEPAFAYYGYSIFAVTRSGVVTLQSWGRPVPDPYDAPAPQPQSILRENLTLVGAAS